jgi:hypothetical protein
MEKVRYRDQVWDVISEHEHFMSDHRTLRIRKADLLTHEDSGRRCAADHGPLEEHCIKCWHCREWIRPNEINEPCPVRNKMN